MFNRDLFRSKIIAAGKAIKDAAAVMGCNEATLYRKMAGESDFTRNEIQLFKQAFGLTSQ